MFSSSLIMYLLESTNLTIPTPFLYSKWRPANYQPVYTRSLDSIQQEVDWREQVVYYICIITRHSILFSL